MTVSVPAERPPSLWEDLLEIFYAPTAVFTRRRETPAFGLALVVLAVVIFVLSLAFKDLMQPLFDVEWKRSMALAAQRDPRITPEVMDRGRAMAEKFMLFGPAVTMLVLPLITGLVYWVIGKVLDSKAEIGQMMMVSTYAYFPKLLETIVAAGQLLVLPEGSLTSRYSVTLGAGRLVDPSHPLLLAIVGRLDLFTLWVTYLLAVGMAVMGRMPKGRAFLAAALMWVVGALPGVLGAVRAAS